MTKFIQLNRGFYLLRESKAEDEISDDALNDIGKYISASVYWQDLLKERRAVILSEAGSGKTEELRQTAIALRNEGKRAFFLRLEHISTDFDSAFEEGTTEEFKEWLNSSDEAWVLLDSIDEARLKGPKDFEAAIRVIGIRASQGLQRSRIILTGRTHAWRPSSDLAHCNKHLPFNNARTGKLEEGSDAASDKPSKKDGGFKIYALSDLVKEQVSTFVKEKGVEQYNALLDAIEKQDTWGFTTRPQDLEELIEYWKQNKQIGSRSELIGYSIARRLQERDPTRATIASLSKEKAKWGAQQLAACASFTHESTIRVPDVVDSPNGIKATEVLPEWNEKECQILLGRPVFDEAIYGTVRFHHRSVREYLTAKWLSELLKKAGSRQRIEGLFFRNQYGTWVIPPSVRPILEWLVLWDERIRERTWKIQPGIILTCGDPALLPLPFRIQTLESVCTSVAEVNSYNEVSDRMAIQRFAQADIADTVKTLIQRYAKSDEVVQFLLQMIWRGQLVSVLPEAKQIALNTGANIYTRIVAIRAVKDMGSAEDFGDVLKSAVISPEPYNRRLLGELVSHLEVDENSVSWILVAVEKAADEERYSVDTLSHALQDYVSTLDHSLAVRLLQGFSRLLGIEPFIERSYCRVSEKYSWLANSCIKIIESLIIARNPAAFLPESLYVLANIGALTDHEYRECKNRLAELVPQCPELNRALLWYGITEARRIGGEEKRITTFWGGWCFGHLWQFGFDDFESVVEDIKKRSLQDDKLVALSIAFAIYRDNKRPRKWRECLKKAVAGIPELEQQLSKYLKPPPQSAQEKNWKSQSARWKREGEAKRSKDARERAEWREKLKVNLGWLENNKYTLKGQVTGAQSGLHECMRKHGENSSHWTEGNWQDLIEEFGQEVAVAFRNGIVAFWRNYKPSFRSEDDTGNTTSFYIIYGLSGLEIEARETADWPKELTTEEAELAFRYAFHELNGFPNWFHKLFNGFPDIGKKVILQEIEWELHNSTEQQERHYLLSKISWSYPWLWQSLANSLFGTLKDKEPDNIRALDYILKIVQGSNGIANDDLAALAQEKCASLTDSNHAAYWFAVWMGTQPSQAIPHFLTYLSTLSHEIAVDTAMQAMVRLIGERGTESNARDSYQTAEHLKSLYLLMHKYVRVEEDLERAGKGAYSPTLRDAAQNARNRLFSILADLPGKEAYLAQKELAESHPVESYKSWMLQNAKLRAQRDAESSPWNVQQFCEFSKDMEKTPNNHRELYDLAVQRLLDFKHDCEEGDNSNAQILSAVKEETPMRNYIAGWCRDRALARYSAPQEDELADAKRPDFRFYGVGFDAPVPVELKLVDNWSGSQLFERFKTQLCEDYLRDSRSNCGIFLLVYRGEKQTWKLPETDESVNFEELLEALRKYWNELALLYPKIESIEVIGIDLTKRSS